jgi:hypothetical protein
VYENIPYTTAPVSARSLTSGVENRDVVGNGKGSSGDDSAQGFGALPKQARLVGSGIGGTSSTTPRTVGNETRPDDVMMPRF